MGWLLSVMLASPAAVPAFATSRLSPSRRPSTRPIQPPLLSDLNAPDTSLPSSATAGAVAVPVTLTSALPPLTSCGRDDRTSRARVLVVCASALEAANAPQSALTDPVMRKILLIIETSLTTHVRGQSAAPALSNDAISYRQAGDLCK